MAFESFFVEFDVLLIFALVAGLLSMKLKIPPVITLLFAGMIIGPNMLGFVQESSIGILSEIGAALLLFMVGVEFSITKLLSTGLRAIIVGILLVAFSFIAMYEVAIELNFGFMTALYIGAMFSFSSTAIIIKILEQKGFIAKAEVPFLIAVLIIEDLLAVFMLTFLSSLGKGGLTGGDIIGSIVLSVSILVFTYLILKKAFEKFSDLFMKFQVEGNMVFFSFGLCLAMSILAGALMLTPSIGAFLAGSLIAGLPNGKKFEKVINPFALVFSSFFFISVGLMIDPLSIISNAASTAIIIAAFIAVVFVATTGLVYLVGSNGRSAVLSGLIMIPIGEFSLLIAQEASGTAPNLVGLASVGVLVTTIISTLLIGKYLKVYKFVKNRIPERSMIFIRGFAAYFSKVVGAFEPHGQFYEEFIAQSKKIFLNLVILAIASAAVFFTRPILNFNLAIGGIDINGQFIFAVFVALLCLLPAIRIAISISKILDTFSKVTTWTESKNAPVKIARKILLGAITIFAAVNIPTINNLLNLPLLFDIIAIPLLVIGIVVIWSAIKEIPVKMRMFWGKQVDVFRDEIVCDQNDLVCISKTSKVKKQQGK